MTSLSPDRSPGKAGSKPRIGILVVAYNAALTLQHVLDRIPASFREKTAKVFVCDDHSNDSTYLIGVGYRELVPELPLEVIRNPRNLGYGGNQKLGYRLALDNDLDIVVLLHGDGQYAPECLDDMVAPIERGEADAVLGSRMMVKGAARKGGMPLYKYMGNRVLTKFQNAVLGMSLTEFHSGYRAYSVEALRTMSFDQNSDGFDFDTEIIIQLHSAGKRIVEVPIPTYYGDEICYVNGVKYARDVVADVLRYRLSRMGFSSASSLGERDHGYALKDDPWSSHGQILRWLAGRSPSSVLDLGCSGGHLAELAGEFGHSTVGVDVDEVPGVRHRVGRFIQANLDQGLPSSVGDGYDVVVAADVIEHVREPEQLLRQIRNVMAPGAVLIASVPNFAHWYPRVRTVTGTFNYDERGILDKTHVRFFTRRSFLRLVRDSGYQVSRASTTGLPLGALEVRGRGGRLVGALDRALVKIRPTLFAYQFIYELRPKESTMGRAGVPGIA